MTNVTLTPELAIKYAKDDESLEKLKKILYNMKADEFWKFVQDFEIKYHTEQERDTNAFWQYNDAQFVYDEILSVMYYSGKNWAKEFSKEFSKENVKITGPEMRKKAEKKFFTQVKTIENRIEQAAENGDFSVTISTFDLFEFGSWGKIDELDFQEKIKDYFEKREFNVKFSFSELTISW